MTTGQQSAPTHQVKEKVVLEYARRYNLRTLVETGTLYGEMIDAVMHSFDQIYSIELGDELYQKAKEKYADNDKVTIIHGDSGERLAYIVLVLDGPTLFWLDAHFSGGMTVRGYQDTPILDELHHILKNYRKGSVILIDDGRCFGTDSAYPSKELLFEIISRYNRQVEVTVEDDIIRITPQ